MTGSALRRLMAEYKQLTLNPPDGIIAGRCGNFFHAQFFYHFLILQLIVCPCYLLSSSLALINLFHISLLLRDS